MSKKLNGTKNKNFEIDRDHISQMYIEGIPITELSDWILKETSEKEDHPCFGDEDGEALLSEAIELHMKDINMLGKQV